MRPFQRFGASPKRRISPQAEPLEHRTLLSGGSAGTQSTGAPAPQVVVIQVPSTYVSQQADQLDVTLVRSAAAGASRSLGPLTINLWAAPGLPPSGTEPVNDIAIAQLIPVSEPVTFQGGVTTDTVVVPIDYSAGVNSGLVPVQLSVTSSSRRVHGSDATIYLANSLDAVPPSIVAVQRVAGGIAVTFSKPMDPATVENKHNYAVKFTPSQQFSLEDLTGVGLVQTLNNTKTPIGLRRATYNAATNTVTLVPNEQLGSAGSYTVSNPSSLLAKRNRPKKAVALTDLQGNPLDEGGIANGVFSITISKGNPYAAATPVLSDGS
jgi:hypothetical protein